MVLHTDILLYDVKETNMTYFNFVNIMSFYSYRVQIVSTAVEVDTGGL